MSLPSRRTVAFTICIFVVAILASYTAKKEYLRRYGSAKAAVVRPESIARKGKQYLFVYVGSSRCAACAAPELPGNVSSLRESIRSFAIETGVGFVSIGVAREMSAKVGLAHLEKIGEFDEVSAGQGDLNVASAHFISVDHRGLPATPQVIVLERTLQVDPDGSVNVSRYEEQVLARKVGLKEIDLWRSQKGILPKTSRQSTNSGSLP